MVDENKKIKYYLPFDNFKTRPTFSDISESQLYKKRVINFINPINKRIDKLYEMKKID